MRCFSLVLSVVGGSRLISRFNLAFAVSENCGFCFYTCGKCGILTAGHCSRFCAGFPFVTCRKCRTSFYSVRHLRHFALFYVLQMLLFMYRQNRNFRKTALFEGAEIAEFLHVVQIAISQKKCCLLKILCVENRCKKCKVLRCWFCAGSRSSSFDFVCLHSTLFVFCAVYVRFCPFMSAFVRFLVVFAALSVVFRCFSVVRFRKFP